MREAREAETDHRLRQRMRRRGQRPQAMGPGAEHEPLEQQGQHQHVQQVGAGRHQLAQMTQIAVLPVHENVPALAPRIQQMLQIGQQALADAMAIAMR